MTLNKNINIALVIPALVSGGMERVMSNLANDFARRENVSVHLILLIQEKKFYKIDSCVTIHEPDFSHKNFIRPVFTLKILMYLRKKLSQLKPDTVLSFGGKYNSFVLLSSTGLKIPIFISDRSRPNISYGKILDVLNPIIYKRAKGIIAQTEKAKIFLHSKTAHKNIKVIGNPIKKIQAYDTESRENIVLNVGRFIKSKRQDLLVKYFEKTASKNWILCFIGDGPELANVKEVASLKTLSNRVFFLGNVDNIEHYYKSASIFAFTSVSEGFPNALGEAMSAGMACISFDCNAGPSDLIDDGINGYLIKEYDDESYCVKMAELMMDQTKRETFGLNAQSKMALYNFEDISTKYFNFILQE